MINRSHFWGVEAFSGPTHADRRILLMLVAEDTSKIDALADLKPSEARRLAAALLREAERAEGSAKLRTSFEVFPAEGSA